MSFHILIEQTEDFDEIKQEFITYPPVDVEFEHSLYTISKWEQKYHKPYLETAENKKLTAEESLYYVECMIVNDCDKVFALTHMSPENYEQIQKEINDPATATWFHEEEKRLGMTHQTITNELLYGQMAVLGIWKECEHWHLNRLLTLIRVCNNLNSPPKKMSKQESAKYQSDLIDRRRAEMKKAQEEAMRAQQQ